MKFFVTQVLGSQDLEILAQYVDTCPERPKRALTHVLFRLECNDKYGGHTPGGIHFPHREQDSGPLEQSFSQQVGNVCLCVILVEYGY